MSLKLTTEVSRAMPRRAQAISGVRFAVCLCVCCAIYGCDTPCGGTPGFNQDMLDEVGRGEWRPILFSLTLMHCILLERRKFGGLGWSAPYEFGQLIVPGVRSEMSSSEIRRAAIRRNCLGLYGV
eukprot:662614-Rhodomonas_salina.2